MKCPICNVWSQVAETRIKDGEYIRTRECANEHRFKTKEVCIGTPRLKRSALALRTGGRQDVGEGAPTNSERTTSGDHH